MWPARLDVTVGLCETMNHCVTNLPDVGDVSQPFEWSKCVSAVGIDG